MNRNVWRTSILVPVLSVLALLTGRGDATPAAAAAPPDAVLPAGVKAVWDLENGPTRKDRHARTRLPERPVALAAGQGRDGRRARRGDGAISRCPASGRDAPATIQEDCQTLYRHPSWKEANLGSVTAAWYQREITVPDDWTGRRIALAAEYVNSFAVVFVDGKKVGEIRFPGGRGGPHRGVPARAARTSLSLLVVAMPLKGVLLSYTDTNSAREVKGTVERRGLCGDVYLVGTPARPRASPT